MAVRKIQVLVTTLVDVEIDDTKVNDAFMAEFRESFYPFDTVEEHAQHIAQLSVRCIIGQEDDGPNEFVEGYGPLAEAGIRYRKRPAETEVCGDA